MFRPKLERGDIVKLSKHGKTYARSYPKNITMIVVNILGTGLEAMDLITCELVYNNKKEIYKFFRSELWKTGRNCFR